MSRNAQNGSVLGFIIVGALMVLLLVGGAYAVNHTFSPKNQVATTPRPDEGTEEPATNGEEGEENSGGSEESTSGSGEEGESQNENGGSVEGGNTEESGSAAAPDSPSESKPEVGTGAPSSLPETGPAGVVASIVMFGVLVATVASYIDSRITVRSSF